MLDMWYDPPDFQFHLLDSHLLDSLGLVDHVILSRCFNLSIPFIGFPIFLLDPNSNFPIQTFNSIYWIQELSLATPGT